MTNSLPLPNTMGSYICLRQNLGPAGRGGGREPRRLGGGRAVREISYTGARAPGFTTKRVRARAADHLKEICPAPGPRGASHKTLAVTEKQPIFVHCVTGTNLSGRTD